MFFDKNKTGALINRLSSDTVVVSKAITMNLSTGLRNVIMASAGFGMMVINFAIFVIFFISIIQQIRNDCFILNNENHFFFC